MCVFLTNVYIADTLNISMNFTLPGKHTIEAILFGKEAEGRHREGAPRCYVPGEPTTQQYENDSGTKAHS